MISRQVLNNFPRFKIAPGGALAALRPRRRLAGALAAAAACAVFAAVPHDATVPLPLQLSAALIALLPLQLAALVWVRDRR